jgi:hypothetical protein
MSKESDNKAVVGRWFAEFWGKDFNSSVIDELASPDMLLKYSLLAWDVDVGQRRGIHGGRGRSSRGGRPGTGF